MRFPADLCMLFTLSCRLASQLLSKAQDTPLTRTERAALRLHLLICRSCRRFNRQLILLRQILRGLVARTCAGKAVEPPLPPGQRRQLLQRIGFAIRKEL